jgi:hypothetical protein
MRLVELTGSADEDGGKKAKSPFADFAELSSNKKDRNSTSAKKTEERRILRDFLTRTLLPRYGQTLLYVLSVIHIFNLRTSFFNVLFAIHTKTSIYLLCLTYSISFCVLCSTYILHLTYSFSFCVLCLMYSVSTD